MSVGGGIMFSGCLFIAYIHLFARTDLTAMYHEQLEQCRWTL